MWLLEHAAGFVIRVMLYRESAETSNRIQETVCKRAVPCHTSAVTDQMPMDANVTQEMGTSESAGGQHPTRKRKWDMDVDALTHTLRKIIITTRRPIRVCR